MQMIAAITLSAALVTTSASALPPLRDVREIDDNMLWVALAIEISDRCDSISPRTLRGLSFLWQLKARASELGYSDDAIDAYVSSKAEKSRMRDRGEAYMRAQGLNPEKDRDLCKLGRREMKKGSQIGAFLKAK